MKPEPIGERGRCDHSLAGTHRSCRDFRISLAVPAGGISRRLEHPITERKQSDTLPSIQLAWHYPSALDGAHSRYARDLLCDTFGQRGLEPSTLCRDRADHEITAKELTDVVSHRLAEAEGKRRERDSHRQHERDGCNRNSRTDRRPKKTFRSDPTLSAKQSGERP